MAWRILFVEMAHGFGGSIVSLYQLVQGLERAIYEPVILFYRPNAYVPRFEELGLRVIVLNPYAGPLRVSGESRLSKDATLHQRLASGLAIARQVVPGTIRLLNVIRDESIDLVHLNDVLISNREGIIAARLAGIPCVSHVRAFEQLTRLDRYLTRYVDAFIYISRAIAAAHEAQGVPAERGRVIYNALDLHEFLQGGDRGAARAKLGLAPSDHVVGLIGRLVAWKGHRIFLQAMACLAKTHPHLRCLIVGDVEPTEPYYRQELEHLTMQLGLSDRVIFTGYCTNIPALLPALDVLVHCSLKPEPFGRVIIEGMAAGVPVVGAADGAVPEIIEDGRSGLLVAPGDAEGLANAVGRLLDDAHLADAIRQAARRRVSELFTVEAHVRQVEEVYRVVLGSGSQRHR